MKSTPILFTPENAQKVHEGKKVQTRRIVNGKAWDIISDLAGEPDPSSLSFQYVKDCQRINDDGGESYLYTGLLVSLEEYPEEGFIELPCPFGTVGDRLWVREAFQLWREGWDRTGHVIYRGGLCDKGGNVFGVDEIGKWTPSIYMPKKYCRTWLELTAVRVERVQEITEDDARAEGCAPLVHEDVTVDCGTRKTTFIALWESIHGPGSWDLNPWVWCLSYRTVQP